LLLANCLFVVQIFSLKKIAMRVVFQDPSLQQIFDEKGYVQVPFLSPAEVAHLKNAYFATLDQRGGGITHDEVDTVAMKERITYDFTFIDKNVGYKQLVFDLITTTFGPHAEKILDNYTPLIANFIRKTEADGEVPLHQNWAFVDETAGTSITIWVPLMDSNEHNGTLQMVDKSHKKFGQTRGPLVPWELDHIKEAIISKHLTPMNVKAGNAIILDDSIIHYSNINQTAGLRLAIQLILIPQEFPSIHYHFPPGNPRRDAVHVWEVDRSFYTAFNPWKIPAGIPNLGKIAFREEYLDEATFVRRLQGSSFEDQKLTLLPLTEADLNPPNASPAPAAAVLPNSGKASFWKTYTPRRIFAEVKHRLGLGA